MPFDLLLKSLFQFSNLIFTVLASTDSVPLMSLSNLAHFLVTLFQLFCQFLAIKFLLFQLSLQVSDLVLQQIVLRLRLLLLCFHTRMKSGQLLLQKSGLVSFFNQVLF